MKNTNIIFQGAKHNNKKTYIVIEIMFLDRNYKHINITGNIVLHAT